MFPQRCGSEWDRLRVVGVSGIASHLLGLDALATLLLRELRRVGLLRRGLPLLKVLLVGLGVLGVGTDRLVSLPRWRD
jgi:hypothetical protein